MEYFVLDQNCKQDDGLRRPSCEGHISQFCLCHLLSFYLFFNILAFPIMPANHCGHQYEQEYFCRSSTFIQTLPHSFSKTLLKFSWLEWKTPQNEMNSWTRGRKTAFCSMCLHLLYIQEAKIFYYLYFCVCVCWVACMCHATCMKTRWQLSETVSLLSYESWRLKSSHQAWSQTSLLIIQPYTSSICTRVNPQ